MLKIYLAGRYGRIDEIRQCAADLIVRDHLITSHWLWPDTEAEIEDVPPDAESFPQEYHELALQDLVDVATADALIAFSERPGSEHGRGGRHVEFGAALMLDKHVTVIGPRENIFHTLPDVETYATWDKFLSGLDSWVTQVETWVEMSRERPMRVARLR